MILDKWCGEQPVGTCMLVPTENKEHPWLAHTPTMRHPMDIRGTDNAYTAMWAMLNAVRQHNLSHEHHADKIKSVACPGLGTGCGRLKFEEAARQMALAWKHFQERTSVTEAKVQAKVGVAAREARGDFSDKTRDFYLIDWETANKKHRAVGAGGTNGLLNWLYKEFPDLEETIYSRLLVTHK